MAVASFGDNSISSLENILRGAVGSANSAVGSAQSGLAAVLGGGSVVSNAVNDMKGNCKI